MAVSPLLAEIRAALNGIQMLIHGSNSLHSRWVPTVAAAAKSNGSELHLKSSAGLIARQLAKVSAVPSSRRTGTGQKSGIKEDRKVGRSRAEFQSTSSPVLPKQLHLRVCQPLLTSIHSRKTSIRPQLRRITLIIYSSALHMLFSHITHIIYDVM